MDAHQPPPSLAAESRTLKATLQRRYVCAENRIRRIVDGEPPLTEAQLQRLALLLHSGRDGAA